jgi:hypothetical protein
MALLPHLPLRFYPRREHLSVTNELDWEVELRVRDRRRTVAKSRINKGRNAKHRFILEGSRNNLNSDG